MKLKHIKKENGQAMVEFALVLIPLFLIIGGIIDFGWIFHKQLLADNACREAARYVSIYHSADYSKSAYKTTITGYVEGYFNDFDENTDNDITLNDISIIDNTVPKNEAGDSVKVGIIYKVEVLTPFLKVFEDYHILDDLFEVKSYTTVRLE